MISFKPSKQQMMSMIIFHLHLLIMVTAFFENISNVASLNANTCENPLGLIRLPNSFPPSDYINHRTQCTDKCNAEGYCCTFGSGGCNYVPCTEGCHIAWFSDSVAACKAECAKANTEDCEYTHSQHAQIATLGFTPWWPFFGVGKKNS